ncbi:hypothetical protein R1flu_000174 [Riccia fluitans]|uniref:Uncharacterized protein n=1 Tax=Riccia fluitans TaxID=41844 RepID=A0ABD1Y3W2_9MARC
MPSKSESLWLSRKAEWLLFCSGNGAARQFRKKLGNGKIRTYHTFIGPEGLPSNKDSLFFLSGEVLSSWNECLEFMNRHKDPAGNTRTQDSDDDSYQGLEDKLNLIESGSTASASTHSAQNHENFVQVPITNFEEPESIWNLKDLMKDQGTKESSEEKSIDGQDDKSSGRKPVEMKVGSEQSDGENSTDSERDVTPIQNQNLVSAVGSSSTSRTKFETDRSHFQKHKSVQEPGHRRKKNKSDKKTNWKENLPLNNKGKEKKWSPGRLSEREPSSSAGTEGNDKSDEDKQKNLPVVQRENLNEGGDELHRSNKRARKNAQRRREKLRNTKKKREDWYRKRADKRLKVQGGVRKPASRRRPLKEASECGDTASRATTDSDMLISILYRSFMERRRSRRRAG